MGHAHAIDIPQLAERLGTRERHVRELVARNEIPHYRIGRLIRFDADDIERWIAELKVSA